jgi:hypothetical protein
MKTLYCDYLVPKSQPTPTGEYWGVLSVTNHDKNVEQTAIIYVMEYETGKDLKNYTLRLPPKGSKLLTNLDEPFKGIIGRVRLYIECATPVTATIGNTKGNTSAISWERMVELPFPK